MKPLIYRFSAIAFFLCGVLFPGQSQHYPDSLIRYMEIAAERNPDVRREFNGYKIALQKIPQAGSLSDPQLSMGFFLKPMEIIGGNQVADITVMQMFPWFGVLKNARDEMSLMANAKYQQFRDAKLQVYFDVQQTWYELFKIKKEISLSEKNSEILKTIERLAIIRFGSGPSGSQSAVSSGPAGSSGSQMQISTGNASSMQSMTGSQQAPSGNTSASGPASMQGTSMNGSSQGTGLADIYRIQIEAGELENNIALLRNQERTVTVLFNSYLNRPPLSAVFTAESMTPDTLRFSEAEVYDSIQTKNPILTMLDYERKSYSSRKKMATAMGYPMVGLGLNYTVVSKSEMSSSEMNGTDMLMPMVTITLPIYRKKYKALRDEAELSGISAAENAESVSNTLNNDYYRALQSYDDSRRRVRLYDSQLMLASKSLTILMKNFSASTASLTDVLRARQQLLDYELRREEAVADQNTSVAWLRRLMASSIVK